MSIRIFFEYLQLISYLFNTNILGLYQLILLFHIISTNLLNFVIFYPFYRKINLF